MTDTTSSLTDKSARTLAKQIVKESTGVKVKQGTTNGRIVLHIIAPGNGEDGVGSRTIYSAGEWEIHPANQRVNRNRNEAAMQESEALVASNEGVGT